jgi:hypothetical protein
MTPKEAVEKCPPGMIPISIGDDLIKVSGFTGEQLAKAIAGKVYNHNVLEGGGAAFTLTCLSGQLVMTYVIRLDGYIDVGTRSDMLKLGFREEIQLIDEETEKNKLDN